MGEAIEELARFIAGTPWEAIPKAFREHAKLVLLEPIMVVEVIAPEEYMGSLIGDLSSRRAVIQETGSRSNVKFVKALAPLMEMFGFASAIRSLSQGRAVPSPMEFHGYKEMPSNIARAIIEGEHK